MLVKTKIEEKAQKIYKDECEKRKKLKCFNQKKKTKKKQKTKNKKNVNDTQIYCNKQEYYLN